MHEHTRARINPSKLWTLYRRFGLNMGGGGGVCACGGGGYHFLFPHNPYLDPSFDPYFQ